MSANTRMLASPRSALVALCLCAVIAANASPSLAAPQDPAERASTSAAKEEKPKTKNTTAPRKEAVRTLEAINIEGEIAVPQVLFITSRDYRRYRDGLGLKFRLSTYEVARTFSVPTRLRVIAAPGKLKEEAR